LRKKSSNLLQKNEKVPKRKSEASQEVLQVTITSRNLIITKMKSTKERIVNALYVEQKIIVGIKNALIVID